MHERWKLTVARWTQLTLNVWTLNGFTAVVHADHIVFIAPTGARRTRKYVS